MKTTTKQQFALSLLAALFCSISAEAASAAELDFAQLDRNQDGRISWQEYAAHNPVSGRLNPRRIFDNVDKNLDGYIDLAEFDAMKRRHANSRYPH